MTIVVDWAVKPQNKQTKNTILFTNGESLMLWQFCCENHK